MSYTLRGKTVGYDNVAGGSATGHEDYVAGTTDVIWAAYADIDNPQAGTTDTGPENISAANDPPAIEDVAN